MIFDTFLRISFTVVVDNFCVVVVSDGFCSVVALDGFCSAVVFDGFLSSFLDTANSFEYTVKRYCFVPFNVAFKTFFILYVPRFDTLKFPFNSSA